MPVYTLLYHTDRDPVVSIVMNMIISKVTITIRLLILSALAKPQRSQEDTYGG